MSIRQEMIGQEATARPRETLQDEPLPLGFLGGALALAFAVLIVANGFLFLAYYRETLIPLTVPYSENFETLSRLDYRQFGGQWRLRDKALVQSNTTSTDLLAVIPLVLAPEQNYQFGVRLNILQGPKGGGLMFNLQHPDSHRQSHLIRFGSGDGKDYLVFGYFDENYQFNAQGSLPPPDISQGVELAVLVHDATYDVLVNGQPQQLAIPLQYKGGNVALTTWFSSVAFDDIYITTPADTVVQNAAPAETTGQNAAPADSAATVPQSTVRTEESPGTAATAVVVPNEPAVVNEQVTKQAVAVAQPVAVTGANSFFTEQFQGNTDQSLWTPLTGDWQFENGALVQQKPDGYDYSISRAGTFARFALSVHFRHRQGAGGGLLFNMPKSETKRNGHLVRYFENNALAWGYFNEENVFTGQGYAAVDPPGDKLHTLQVIVGDTAYAILLDNRMIAENIPLISTAGHIGLTGSNSVVAFEEIIITQIQ
jgi:hypothetical protein